jgi:hypothetical protein
VFATPESKIFVLDDDPAFWERVRAGLGGVFEVVVAGLFRKGGGK